VNSRDGFLLAHVASNGHGSIRRGAGRFHSGIQRLDAAAGKYDVPAGGKKSVCTAAADAAAGAGNERDFLWLIHV
jgi:hypothetical protein